VLQVSHRYGLLFLLFERGKLMKMLFNGAVENKIKNLVKVLKIVPC